MKSSVDTVKVAASTEAEDSVVQADAKPEKNTEPKAKVAEVENGTEVASAADAASKKNLK
jgi:hypothetical protein